MAALPVLDHDDPKVGIEGQLLRQVAIGLGLGSGQAGQARLPTSLGVLGTEARRRRPEEAGAAVEPADLDVNGARIGIAAALEEGGGTFQGAAAQVGFDPKFGFQAHARQA